MVGPAPPPLLPPAGPGAPPGIPPGGAPPLAWYSLVMIGLHIFSSSLRLSSNSSFSARVLASSQVITYSHQKNTWLYIGQRRAGYFPTRRLTKAISYGRETVYSDSHDNFCNYDNYLFLTNCVHGNRHIPDWHPNQLVYLLSNWCLIVSMYFYEPTFTYRMSIITDESACLLQKLICYYALPYQIAVSFVITTTNPK